MLGSSLGGRLALELARRGRSTLVDVPGRMSSIDCPVTLGQGTHDVVATGQTPRFLALVPGARFRPLVLAGHVPFTDAPERIVRLVRETAARAGAR